MVYFRARNNKLAPYQMSIIENFMVQVLETYAAM